MRDFVSFCAGSKRLLKNLVRVKVRVKTQKKVLKPLGFQDFLWQRVKDSNPHIQSQSLLCYLYTNPLFICCSHGTGFIIQILGEMSIGFFKNFKKTLKKIWRTEPLRPPGCQVSMNAAAA